MHFAEYSTRSNEFGDIRFTVQGREDRPHTGYVYIEGDELDRRQICEGGLFRGPTVRSTPEGLAAVAQNWLRQRRDWRRREGLNDSDLTEG